MAAQQNREEAHAQMLSDVGAETIDVIRGNDPVTMHLHLQRMEEYQALPDSNSEWWEPYMRPLRTALRRLGGVQDLGLVPPPAQGTMLPQPLAQALWNIRYLNQAQPIEPMAQASGPLARASGFRFPDSRGATPPPDMRPWGYEE